MDPDYGFEEQQVGGLAGLRAEFANRYRAIEGCPDIVFAIGRHEGEDQVHVARFERSPSCGNDRAVERVAVRRHRIPSTGS